MKLVVLVLGLAIALASCTKIEANSMQLPVSAKVMKWSGDLSSKSDEEKVIILQNQIKEIQSKDKKSRIEKFKQQRVKRLDRQAVRDKIKEKRELEAMFSY